MTVVKAQTAMVYSSFVSKKERKKQNIPKSLFLTRTSNASSLSLSFSALSSPLLFPLSTSSYFFSLSLSISNLAPHLSPLSLSLDDLLSLTANSLGFPLSLPIQPWRHKSNKVLSLPLSLFNHFDRFDFKKIVRYCILTL